MTIAYVVAMTFPQYHDYLRTGVLPPPEEAARFDVSGNGGALTPDQAARAEQACAASLLSPTAEPVNLVEIDPDYVPSAMNAAQPSWADMPSRLKELNRRGSEAAKAAARGDSSKMTVLRDDIEDIEKGLFASIPPEQLEQLRRNQRAQPQLVSARRPASASSTAALDSDYNDRSDEWYAAHGVPPEVVELDRKTVRIARRMLDEGSNLVAVDALVHALLDKLGVDVEGEASRAAHAAVLKAFEFGLQMAVANVLSGHAPITPVLIDPDAISVE